MGLGLLGRGVGDIKFLAEAGADLIVTDLKSEDVLSPSLKQLQNLRTSKPINFVLGEHRLEDFRNRDFILKAAGVPLDSVYITEAKKCWIPIKMSASWFAELAEGVKIVGVTGTRGKSTTTVLIYEILKKAGRQVFLGGNIRGVSTLAFLNEAKPGDIAVLELDSWQLQGFGEAEFSPQVAVFTTFLDDHLNYYKGDRDMYFEDKANIFKYQKKGDVLVVSEMVTEDARFRIHDSRMKIAKKEEVPKDWKIQIPGEHNLSNIACAFEAVKVLGVPLATIKEAVEEFKGVEGRLQDLGIFDGVRIYNDNNATTPDATVAALKALNKNIILICGGSDKGLDMTALVTEIPKHCKAIVLLSGSGSLSLLTTHYSLPTKVEMKEVANLGQALDASLRLAAKGDIIIFSPAFASFGLFKNEYDRNDQFLELVEKLKNR